MAFLYIHSKKYTINKQTYALNSQSQLYSKSVFMNIMLDLTQKPHLLNKQSCVADYICTHITRLYRYKLETTVNAYSEECLVIQCLTSYQFSYLPYGDIALDLFFLLSLSIHVLNLISALSCFESNPLGVNKALRKRPFKF